MTNQTNTANVRETEPGRLWVNSRFEEVLREAGLLSFEALYSARKATLTKDKPQKLRTNFMLKLDTDDGEHVFYLKRHRPMSMLRALLCRLVGRSRVSPGRTEWENIFLLNELDIPTMTPVALGDDRQAGRSFTLTEALPNARPLDVYVGEVDADTRRALARQLGELVGRLHAARLTHRDLYLSHVFAVTDKDKTTTLHLIDLQRVGPRTRRLRRWCIKDIAQLEYSRPIGVTTRTDLLRFLYAYFGCDRLGPVEKSFVRRVSRKVRRIAGHDRKLKSPKR